MPCCSKPARHANACGPSARLDASVRAAVAHLGEEPAVFGGLLDWLAARLRRNAQDGDALGPTNGDLLALAAAAGECWPAQLKGYARDTPAFERRLLEAVQFHDTFTGRCAALSLLGRLERFTPDAMTASSVALRDVAEVQAAALHYLSCYRRLEPDSLPRLISALRDASPLLAHAAGQQLAALGGDELLAEPVRSQVIQALAVAIAHPASRRELCLLVRERRSERSFRTHGGTFRLESRGPLAESLGESLLELSGVSSLLCS